MPVENPEFITILEEGVAIAVYPKMNFIGAGITAVADPTNGRVNVTVSAGGGDMLKSVYDPEDEGAIRLTPRVSSSGAEGTIFYDSDDDHVYVATE